MMYRPLQEGKLFAKNSYLADLGRQGQGRQELELERLPGRPVSSTTYKDKVVGVPAHHRAGGPLLPQGPAQEGRHRRPAEDAGRAEGRRREGRGGQPRHGRVRRPDRQVRGRHPVLQLPLQLRRRLRPTTAARRPSTPPRPSRPTPCYGGLLKDHGPKNVSTDMSWPQAMAIFTQGKAAFYTEAELALQERHRPGQVQGRRHGRLRAVPGRPGRLQALQRPVVGAGHQRRVQEPGQRLEVHRLGDEQGADAQEPGGRACRRRAPRSGPTPKGIATYPKDLAAAIAVSTKTGVGHRPPAGRQGRRGP